MVKTLRQRALEIAQTQVGEHENPLGSNWGHPVQDYLASVGIKFAAAWCAAFQFWCFAKAALELGVKNTMPQTGGVLDMWAKCKAFHVNEPESGDVFFMNLGKGLGHMGIVFKVDKTFIYTIDGNTNDSGSREGIAVEYKQRPRAKILGYARFV